MEFKNIKTFLKVAELRNFSKAAEKLGYSQSAVTIQIQQLERELGVQLFERIGKGAALTEEGQSFVFYANEILGAAEKAKESIRKGREGTELRDISGQLRIGSVESVATALLPGLLMRYHKLCPGVEILVHTAGRDELLERIRSNRLDLFFNLEKKAHYPGMERKLLKEERIIFIAPASGEQTDPELNTRLRSGKISAREMSRLPFALTERGESYRYELERLLAESDAEIHSQLEIANTETIVHMVEEGFGLSFLPAFSAAKAIEAGKVFEVETELPSVYMWSQLFYHKNKWIYPQMEVFLGAAEEYFSQCGG
mgnify:FL=1